MLENLSTEKRNKRTENLDCMTTEEFCHIMNEEDHKVAEAVKEALPQIAKAIDAIVAAVKLGGRLIYAGAGTSGRLGVIDAAECVPTFGVSSNLVVAIIAGGSDALIRSKEGAEDSKELAIEDMKKIALTSNDVVFGLAASGRTPYVISALDYAAEVGALPIALSCNKNTAMSNHAKIAIEIDAGPEVHSGSTRLKAGTVQKLVLNMVSTGVMVQYGKVYKNLMVDMTMTNEKLKNRGQRIVMEATGVSADEAAAMLERSGGKVKIAIVMILAGCGLDEAAERLLKADGFVRRAI